MATRRDSGDPVDHVGVVHTLKRKLSVGAGLVEHAVGGTPLGAVVARLAKEHAVPGAEVVIEFEVRLLTFDSPEESVRGKSEHVLTTARLPAEPAITRRIQPADLVVVRQRHLAQELRHKSGRIDSPPVRVPGGTLDYRVGTIGLGGNVLQGTEYARVPESARVWCAVRIRRRRPGCWGGRGGR